MRRPVLLIASLCTLVLLAPLAAQEGELPPPGEGARELFLATLTAGLDADGRVTPLGVTIGPRGPLFSVRAVVSRLGGTLTVGPLGQSHSLELGGTEFLFGPGSAALTVGQEIIDLSQPPIMADDGLRVPLDLLEAIYTELAGKRLAWRADERRLTVSTGGLRTLPVSVDVVHIQGVSTVVLQFPERPRYRIEELPGRVRVHIIGDRIAPPPGVSRANEGLLRGLEFGEQEIAILLRAGAGMESYELTDPYRLVLDLFPGRGVEPRRSAALPPSRDRIPTIVLDPGHGGSATGAEGDGLLEKDFTLRIARLLRSKLQSVLGVRVVLTRDEDADLPLETRSAIANQLKAELFVSLHLNASFGSRATGAETYFLSLEASDERAQRAAEEANLGAGAGDPLTDLQLILWDMAQTSHLAASQRLAVLIQEELNMTLGLRDRGVKQAPFSVLMGAAMPAVLVELGFISNPSEVERLQDPVYQNELADALTRAILRFRAPTSGSGGPATEVPQ
jgi:N-acetylmuramoyl-L-alanine amidase